MRWELRVKAILFSCSWSAAPPEPTPPPSEMMCSMWIFCLVLSVAGTVWVWCLYFSSCLLSGAYFTELAGLSQRSACPRTLLALPALGHEGKFLDGPNISRGQGNMTLRGRLRGHKVYKFTREALTFVAQAYNMFFKGKIFLLQSLENS